MQRKKMFACKARYLRAHQPKFPSYSYRSAAMTTYKISHVHLTCIAASRMNNFASSPHIAGTVNTKSMSFSENTPSASREFMVCINVSFKFFIEMEKMSMALIFFPVISLMTEFRCRFCND